MKIVFFGNTKYSAKGQEIIHQKFPLSLVVTIPNRPSGRKRELKPSPVKKFAQENSIPVLETDKLTAETIEAIKKINPDFLIVEDYGLILPESLLEIPKYAPLNIHHSLLPKYRGPSPAPTAILNGEKISGVTIISMTEIVDAGDMLAQKEYELKLNETTDSLLTTLNKMGAELVLKVMEDFQKGRKKPKEQNHKEATHTQRLHKNDGYIDPENPPDPETFDRMVRAYFPWPTVWSKLTINGKWLMVKFLPATGLNPVHYLIQPEGKRPMTIKEFLNGYPQARELIEKLKS